MDETFACVQASVEPCTTSCDTIGERACSQTCEWSSCTPPTETCNGVDDDCANGADDTFPCVQGESESCHTSCESSGTRSCSNQCQWNSCLPPEETCNGSDDDCDGSPDNLSGCRSPFYRFFCGTDHVLHSSDNALPSCSLENNGNPVGYLYTEVVTGRSFSTMQLYTLHRPSPPDHFYTIAVAERDVALTQGYLEEESLGACSESEVSGVTLPLYGLVHRHTGDHMYTVSEYEKDQAVAYHGYILLGITCHVWPQ